MKEFNYPKSKQELVALIVERYPADIKRFRAMKVKQLRAIWLGILRNHLRNGKGAV